jgi:hypothetical protein
MLDVSKGRHAFLTPHAEEMIAAKLSPRASKSQGASPAIGLRAQSGY